MSLKKKSLLPGLVFSLLLFSGISVEEIYAQNRREKISVHGVVKDSEGEPITGASVLEVGTKNGVITGFEGDYKLEVTKGKSYASVSSASRMWTSSWRKTAMMLS